MVILGVIKELFAMKGPTAAPEIARGEKFVNLKDYTLYLKVCMYYNIYMISVQKVQVFVRCYVNVLSLGDKMYSK